MLYVPCLKKQQHKNSPVDDCCNVQLFNAVVNEKQ